jgi:hypothetical protein
MDINKDCFLDMVLDERIEAYFTGEKVENWKASRKNGIRFFKKNTQRLCIKRQRELTLSGKEFKKKIETRK